MVQWLRLHASNAGGTGLIPGLGTKISRAACQEQVSRMSSHALLMVMQNCTTALKGIWHYVINLFKSTFREPFWVNNVRRKEKNHNSYLEISTFMILALLHIQIVISSYSRTDNTIFSPLGFS